MTSYKDAIVPFTATLILSWSPWYSPSILTVKFPSLTSLRTLTASMIGLVVSSSVLLIPLMIALYSPSTKSQFPLVSKSPEIAKSERTLISLINPLIVD